MPKFKKVGRSKSPLAHQLPIMAENLSKKLNRSVKIQITQWCHSQRLAHMNYQLSIVPGIYKENCDQVNFITWDSLMDHYFFLLGRK